MADGLHFLSFFKKIVHGFVWAGTSMCHSTHVEVRRQVLSFRCGSKGLTPVFGRVQQVLLPVESSHQRDLCFSHLTLLQSGRKGQGLGQEQGLGGKSGTPSRAESSGAEGSGSWSF